VGARVGQVGVEGLIDLFGLGNGAVGMSAAIVRLTAGSLGVGLRRAFAKRSGLPLTGPLRFLKLPGQLGDLGFELFQAFAQLLASRTLRITGGVHARSVVERLNERKRALNKYVATYKITAQNRFESGNIT
jgi:hypothetical protein